ncbi:hypothetical protein [Anaeroselena agilis]|uniref:Uncharacterized protein n=1 Tax=Anaeroselena agilis TaxID=3063788 RepID=A0ABU3NXM6_9FIRM|nr:hypothetical protein [Selenomonadales bacterium 4137-cl]
MYQALQAFFMTGTGNSYKVACWCAQTAGRHGLDSNLVQIRAGEPSLSPPPGSLAVFTYPTHGFTAPWLMMKYIWRLPPGGNSHAVVLPTRAGIRFKGILVPGLEGPPATSSPCCSGSEATRYGACSASTCPATGPPSTGA